MTQRHPKVSQQIANPDTEEKNSKYQYLVMEKYCKNQKHKIYNV